MTESTHSAPQPLDVLRQINQAWLRGRPQDMTPLLHPDIVMVHPGFGGQTTGRDAFVRAFADFCGSADIMGFLEIDQHVHVLGATAVVSYAFDLRYAREGTRYRSTGRDLWVFSRGVEHWLAVWRTMLDPTEEPV